MNQRSGALRQFEIRGAAAPAGRLMLEQAIAELSGVTDVWVDVAAGRLFVRGQVAETAVLAAILRCGYSAARMRRRRLLTVDGGLQRCFLVATGGAAVVFVLDTVGQAVAGGAGLRGVSLLIAVVVSVWAGSAVRDAASAGGAARGAGLEALFAAALAASWLHAGVALVASGGLPAVAAGGYLALPLVGLALYLAGRLLEQRASGPGRRAANSLRALLPRAVTVEMSDGPQPASFGALRVGHRVHVGPGERVPADGVVVAGAGMVNEALLTGDPTPVDKRPGSEVTGGTLNCHGEIVAAITHLGEDSLLGGMIRGIREARRDRPAAERPVDRLAALALVAGVAAALLVLVAWWRVAAPGWGVFAACTLLMLAAPPALALARPLATGIGLARLAECGAVARGGDALESLQRLTVVVLDNTGTVTVGGSEVVAVEPVDGVGVRELFSWAAAVECLGRPGPVTRAARDRGLTPPPAEVRESLEGGGTRARVEGRTVLLGGAAAMAAAGIANPLAGRGEELQDEASSPLFVAVDGAVAGVIALADTPCPEAASAVGRLRAAGLRVIMLAGDDERTARAVAAGIGIDEVVPAVLPGARAARIRALQQAGERVGMVGDGTNDVAALVQADVGFAVAGGSDVAVQSADVTVVRDSLHAVMDALDMARAAARNSRENAAAAFAYNVVGMPVAAGIFHEAFGWALTPGVLAVLVMLGLLTVATNANRLRFYEVPGADAW